MCIASPKGGTPTQKFSLPYGTGHQEADSLPKGMERQVLDRLTSETLVSITSLKTLVQGYILNCRCEGKSSKTLATYAEHLRRLLWYCDLQGFPDDPQKLTTHHIRSFLWYVASEPVHWGATSNIAKTPAGQSTVNHYYRVLNTSFSWLKREGVIGDNPLAHLKTPSVEHKVVQALLSLCSPKTLLGCRNRTMLMMLLDSGIGVSGLANLTLNDVDMDTGAILAIFGRLPKGEIVTACF